MPPRKKVMPIETVTEEPVIKQQKVRKSKKAIQVVAVVTPNGIEGNFNV